MILTYTFAARYTYARNETKLGMKRKPTVISCGWLTSGPLIATKKNDTYNSYVKNNKNK